MFSIGPFELIIVCFVLLAPLAIIVGAIVVSKRSRNTSPMNENLTSCPDCKQSVSVRAVACPHCGRPLDPYQQPLA